MSTTYPTATDDERETAIEAAAQAVQQGRLVVLPTDTVYGIGADAFDHPAVKALLDAKGRGREMPPPVLISSATTLDALATGLPAYVEPSPRRSGPAPLTARLHQQTSLTWDLGDTRGTVAVRMPDHEVALALLERTGPMAVSSANLSGLPAATEAGEAEGMLGDERRGGARRRPVAAGRGLDDPRRPRRRGRGCCAGARSRSRRSTRCSSRSA